MSGREQRLLPRLSAPGRGAVGGIVMATTSALTAVGAGKTAAI